MPVDQFNIGTIIGLVSVDADLAQVITPTLSVINSVKLALYPLLQGLFEISNIAINIRNNWIDGAILGTSNSITFGSDSPDDSNIATFNFNPPVSVAPGQQYAIEIVNNGGIGNVIGVGIVAPSYSAGRAAMGGNVVSGVNIYFQHVGSTTPFAPLAPTNLTCVTNGSNEFDLAWTNNGGSPTGFIVQRSTDEITFVTIATLGVVTSYADLIATSAKKYYQVIATNTVGNSAPSNVASAGGGAPNAITNLAAVASGSFSVNLTWTNNGGGITGVILQRSLDQSTWSHVATLGVVTSYTDAGLTTATNYYYQTIATNSFGQSAASNIASAGLSWSDNYDSYTVGALPNTWLQWGSSGAMTATVVASTALDSTGTNALSKGTAKTQQIWPNSVTFPNDVTVSCLILPSVSAGCGIIFRCTNPNSATPTFYYLECGRNGGCYTGANVAGTYRPILQSCTAPFTANGSVFKITAHIQGNTIKCSQQCVFDAASPGFGRTGQWLQNDGTGTGTWITSQNEVFCLIVNDSTIASGGVCGVFDGNGGDTRACLWDDFQVTTSAIDTVPPVITLTSPADGSTQPGSILLQATATDNIAMGQVDWYADGSLGTPIATQLAPGIGNNVYAQTLPQGNLGNGTHTIQAKATDLTGNTTLTPTVSITVTGSPTPVRPNIVHARSWINTFQSAFTGFPWDANAQFIAPFVDIADSPTTIIEPLIRAARPVITITSYLSFSAIQVNLLMSWLNYADATAGYTREDAFYHVTALVPCVNQKGSSTEPVTSFWQLFNTGSGSQASGGNVSNVTQYVDDSFTWTPTSGNSSYVGYPERFRSITTLGQVAAGPGYTYVLEYCNAIDGSGNATGWNTLTVLSDTTSALTTSGTIDFDPPLDWIPAIAPGQPNSFVAQSGFRYFYVRFRCTHAANSGATSPTSTGIRANDFYGIGLHFGEPTGTLTVDSSINTRVRSASYNFLATDVGLTLTVKPGSTGWTVGNYTITSVTSPGAGIGVSAANLATSPAAAGTGGGITVVWDSPMTAPLFDSASDGGSKGWLTAAEYAGRAAGKDAHFYYETRKPGGYGAWRMDTNPSNVNFVNWVVAACVGDMAALNSGDLNGNSIDNSAALLPNNVPPTDLLENPNATAYANAYASMLQLIWNSLGTHANGSKRFVLPNITNDAIAAPSTGVAVVKKCPAAYMEFLFHAFEDSWHDWEAKTAGLLQIQTATPPTPPITCPDFANYSAPYGSQLLTMQDPKNNYNTLCAYYQFKDSNTFITRWTGNDDSGNWANHYSVAEAVNVGQPLGASTGSAAAADPNDSTRTYKVYTRLFDNAIVLWRPLSFLASNQPPGIWYTGSAPVSLGASYYQVVTPCVVLGTSSGTGGAIRVQYDGINSGLLTEGQQVRVAFVFGTTEANGVFPIHIVDSTHVELSGTTFANAFTSSPNAQMFWIAQTPVITVNLVSGQGMILVNSPSLAI